MANAWHVVSNREGMILGVYGEALLSEAQDLCRRVEQATGLRVYLHSVVDTDRPAVGGSISMQGVSLHHHN
jgi:hypothetical protein